MILDEIGRGTSTFDGLSIAWAVVEHITSKIKAKTLFATHYHELTEIEGILDGVKNYKITVKEQDGSIVFVRKIMRGGANRSFGIEVAELAGVPKNIISRSKQILSKLEKSDLSKQYKKVEKSNDNDNKDYSIIEQTIQNLEIDSLSPIQAFSVLYDLKEKLKDI